MSAPDTRNVRQRTDESRLPLSLYKEDPSRDPERIQRMREKAGFEDQLKRFNASKVENVDVHKKCDRRRLVLYPIPPPPAKPAKAAVPDSFDGLDGHPSALRPDDLFYALSLVPSAPAVPLGAPNMDSTVWTSRASR